MSKKQDELSVFLKIKDLCSYIFTVTDKSPKKFRFTLTSKLQNLSLDVLEDIFKANEIFLSKSDNYNQRLQYQNDALVNLKLLSYISLLSREQNCVTAKQYEQISLKISESQNLLGGWVKSDKKRLK